MFALSLANLLRKTLPSPRNNQLQKRKIHQTVSTLLKKIGLEEVLFLINFPFRANNLHVQGKYIKLHYAKIFRCLKILHLWYEGKTL